MINEEKYRDQLNHNVASDKDELSQFIDKSMNAKLPAGKGKAKIWDEIESKLDDSETNSNKWIWYAAAAVVALIITFSLVIQSPIEQIQISTGIAETNIHELPDGSIATLNANSLLSYSEDWNRQLELSGEAFFEVEKGEKFSVTTPTGVVQVLGTSFNVFSRNGELDVQCLTGKVNVSISSKGYSENIVPGEMITFRADTVRKSHRKPELMGRWKSGEFYFNNQPFADVMDELKRQFKIQIEFEGEEEIEFNGYFTNRNLDQALDMVCLPLGLSYQKVSTSRVVISENE